MKDKYYSPDDSEFCVGFEYEYNDDDGSGTDPQWYTTVIENASRLESVARNLWKHYSEYRVKYLDKEDIESLGFKKDTEEWHEYWNNFIREFDWGVITIRVRENKRDLLIYCLSRNNDSRCLYEGIIKNKSELKRLLIQLRIINNE